jgi:hypothetical protein
MSPNTEKPGRGWYPTRENVVAGQLTAVITMKGMKSMKDSNDEVA